MSIIYVKVSNLIYLSSLFSFIYYIFRFLLRATILGGEFNGKEVFIPRLKLEIGASEQLGFVFTRLQFPVKLAAVMTINKSQGQSLG